MTGTVGHTPTQGELVAVLKECADDLEGWISNAYSSRDKYPSEMRRYNRDMDLVERALALIKRAEG